MHFGVTVLLWKKFNLFLRSDSLPYSRSHERREKTAIKTHMDRQKTRKKREAEKESGRVRERARARAGERKADSTRKRERQRETERARARETGGGRERGIKGGEVERGEWGGGKK